MVEIVFHIIEQNPGRSFDETIKIAIEKGEKGKRIFRQAA